MIVENVGDFDACSITLTAQTREEEEFLASMIAVVAKGGEVTIIGTKAVIWDRLKFDGDPGEKSPPKKRQRK